MGRQQDRGVELSAMKVRGVHMARGAELSAMKVRGLHMARGAELSAMTTSGGEGRGDLAGRLAAPHAARPASAPERGVLVRPGGWGRAREPRQAPHRVEGPAGVHGAPNVARPEGDALQGVAAGGVRGASLPDGHWAAGSARPIFGAPTACPKRPWLAATRTGAQHPSNPPFSTHEHTRTRAQKQAPAHAGLQRTTVKNLGGGGARRAKCSAPCPPNAAKSKAVYICCKNTWLKTYQLAGRVKPSNLDGGGCHTLTLPVFQAWTLIASPQSVLPAAARGCLMGRALGVVLGTGVPLQEAGSCAARWALPLATRGRSIQARARSTPPRDAAENDAAAAVLTGRHGEGDPGGGVSGDVCWQRHPQPQPAQEAGRRGVDQKRPRRRVARDGAGLGGG